MRAVLATVLALGVAAAAAAQQSVATLTYTLGDVQVCRAGGDGCRQAQTNQALFPGDRIKTGTDGRAELAFASTSRIRLAERTDMLIPVTPQNQGGLLQRVTVSLGALWANVRRLASNESFEVEGAYSIGGVKGTRFSLVRSLTDRWRLAEGRLLVRRLAGAGEAELTEGQELDADAGKLGPPRRGDKPDMDKSWLDFNRIGSQRWQGVVTTLLAAERRLVDQARKAPPGQQADLQARSAEIGRSLQDVRTQVTTFLRDREGDAGDREHGSGDLLGFVDRAIVQWKRLDAELAAFAGPGGPGTPGERPGGGPGSEPGAGGVDSGVLQIIGNADRFLTTYHQALQRFAQALRQTLNNPAQSKLTKPELIRIRDRILGGYRNAETQFQRAREAARGGGGTRTPRVEAAFRQLEQLWRRIQRDLRLARELIDKLKDLMDKVKDPILPPRGGGQGPGRDGATGS